MADEAHTLGTLNRKTIGPGHAYYWGAVTGTIDYDATSHGNALDLTGYVKTLYGAPKLTAVNDTTAGVVATYVADATALATVAATTLVRVDWSADGTDGEALKEMADTTNLSTGGYVWNISFHGEPATS
jgi:hypothetical protein